MPSNLQSVTKQHLIQIVNQQRIAIQSMANERHWLQDDNHIHRGDIDQYKGMAAQWQRYAQEKEKQLQVMAEELKQAKQLEQRLNSGMAKVVVDHANLREENNKLKIRYFQLEEKYKATKQHLHYGLDLGRSLFYEYLNYKRAYTELLYRSRAPCSPFQRATSCFTDEHKPTSQSNSLLPFNKFRGRRAPPRAVSYPVFAFKISLSTNIFNNQLPSRPVVIISACKIFKSANACTVGFLQLAENSTHALPIPFQRQVNATGSQQSQRDTRLRRFNNDAELFQSPSSKGITGQCLNLNNGSIVDLDTLARFSSVDFAQMTKISVGTLTKSSCVITDMEIFTTKPRQEDRSVRFLNSQVKPTDCSNFSQESFAKPTQTQVGCSDKDDRMSDIESFTVNKKVVSNSKAVTHKVYDQQNQDNLDLHFNPFSAH